MCLVPLISLISLINDKFKVIYKYSVVVFDTIKMDIFVLRLSKLKKMYLVKTICLNILINFPT